MRVLAVTTWLPTPSHPSMGSFVVKDARAIASLGHQVLLAHLVPPHQGEVAPRGSRGRRQPAQSGFLPHRPLPHRTPPHQPLPHQPLPLQDEVEGLPVLRIPMSTTRPDHVLAARRALRPLVDTADVLHTMAFSSLLPLAGLGSRLRVPWVHTDHWSGLTTPESLPRAWRLTLPALLPLLRAPDVATAVVERLARPIRDARGADRPTLVVPCVVPAPPGGPPPRKEPDGTIDLVDVGGLVAGKDPLLAVDVVAELQRRGHPTRLRLVGDGPLAEDVRRRAAHHGVTEQVTLVGTLDRTGVLAELARADLFLGPTRSDNFYVSVAEAIVSGRPVVAGANGGHAEYLDRQVSRLVPAQDATAYADAVLDLLDATRDLTADDIAATLGGRFEPDRVAEGYQHAYDLAARIHHQRRAR